MKQMDFYMKQGIMDGRNKNDRRKEIRSEGDD